LVGRQTERVEKHYKYKRFVATKQICVQSHDISALDTLTLTNVSSASGGSGDATSGYLLFFFLFFSAFLGVSRQGEFENTRKKLSTFQKDSPGKYFSGGGGVPGGFF
jgi:hypothetical protein